jgi:sporulation protein YlmC with PRC-barrel domain
MSTSQDRYDRSVIGPEDYSETTMLPSLDQLGGMEVRDVSGEKIGTVDDSYTDTEGTYVRYLAVKTGWFGNKRHMIPVDDVRAESDGDQTYLTVPYDKDHLRDAPTHDRDEQFTRSNEEATYGHYGRAGYWDAVRARQTTPAPTPEIAEAEVDDAIRRGDDPNQVAVKRWGV